MTLVTKPIYFTILTMHNYIGSFPLLSMSRSEQTCQLSSTYLYNLNPVFHMSPLKCVVISLQLSDLSV